MSPSTIAPLLLSLLLLPLLCQTLPPLRLPPLVRGENRYARAKGWSAFFVSRFFLMLFLHSCCLF